MIPEGPAPSGIERFAHLFLTLDDCADRPAPRRLPFDEHRALAAFFGWDDNPFREDPEYAAQAPTAQHEAALARLRRCLDGGPSLGMLASPRGMGEGWIVRRFAEESRARADRLIEIRAERGLTAAAFLRCLLHGSDLAGIRGSGGSAVSGLLALLRERLAAWHRDGVRLTILITEAQHLAGRLLDCLKAITNLTAGAQGAVTLVLFGDDGLARRIRDADFAPLAGRIFIRETLRPLDAAESREYLERKRERVRGRKEFSPRFHEDVHAASGGLCREIDRLACNALVTAYLAGDQDPVSGGQ